MVRERLEEQPMSKAVEDAGSVRDFLELDGERAIERLLRLNVYLARRLLFEDYFNVRYMEADGVETVNGHFTHVRENVSQYSK